MTDSTKACSVGYEELRLSALAEYRILDTADDPAFDEIAEVASVICEAPIAVINFIDCDRQWFKSVKGLAVRETPLDVSICVHAILQPGLFVVPDTLDDPRFANNPLVTGDPGLRFYAGALLESRDGYPLGTLCVLDYQPRELNERQLFALQALANQVMAHLELMRTHREQKKLIAELEAVREELAERASTDPLTGLLNRRAFEQRLAQEVALIKRGAPAAAILVLDLDHFKRVNDDFGHQVGDRVLVRFAELCGEVFRQADVVARWGGEEFIVLMPRTTLKQANRAAERVRKQLARIPFKVEAVERLRVTVSIGISELTETSPPHRAIHAADQMLYRAKKLGRNCTVFEPPGGV